VTKILVRLSFVREGMTKLAPGRLFERGRSIGRGGF